MLFYLSSNQFCSVPPPLSPLCMFLSQGNVTFSCAEPVSVAVTFPGPHSFLQLPLATASSSGGVSVGFEFRTWNRAGLLLTFALPQEGGVVWLYLREARLRLQIHKAGRALLELSAGQSDCLQNRFLTPHLLLLNPYTCILTFIDKHSVSNFTTPNL